MRAWILAFIVLAMGIAGGQEKTPAGFTKSPTEHIINRIDEPFVVRSVAGIITRQTSTIQEPLRNVLFEIQGPGADRKIRRTKTDENGRFEIHRVPPGSYVFKATLNGFQPVTGTITVSKEVSKSREIKIAMNIGV
jgi:hypothetical protein